MSSDGFRARPAVDAHDIPDSFARLQLRIWDETRSKDGAWPLPKILVSHPSCSRAKTIFLHPWAAVTFHRHSICSEHPPQACGVEIHMTSEMTWRCVNLWKLASRVLSCHLRCRRLTDVLYPRC